MGWNSPAGWNAFGGRTIFSQASHHPSLPQPRVAPILAYKGDEPVSQSVQLLNRTMNRKKGEEIISWCQSVWREQRKGWNQNFKYFNS